MGISVRLGDFQIDSTRGWGGYEASVRKDRKLVELIRPLPFSVHLITVREVRLAEENNPPEALHKTVEAALRTYEKEHLKEGERILDQDITFSEEQGVIKADVLMELQKDIAVEKKIDREKEEVRKKK